MGPSGVLNSGQQLNFFGEVGSRTAESDLAERLAYMTAIRKGTSKWSEALKFALELSFSFFPLFGTLGSASVRSGQSHHTDATALLQKAFPELAAQERLSDHSFAALSLLHVASLEASEALSTESNAPFFAPYLSEHVASPYQHKQQAPYSSRSSVEVVFERRFRSMYSYSLGEEGSILYVLHVSSDHSMETLYSAVQSLRTIPPLNEQFYDVRLAPVILAVPTTQRFALPSIQTQLHDVDNVQIVFINEYSSSIVRALEPHLQAQIARLAQGVPAIPTIQVHGVFLGQQLRAGEVDATRLSWFQTRLQTSKKTFYGNSHGQCLFSSQASSQWYGLQVFPGQRAFFHASSLLHYWSVQSSPAPRAALIPRFRAVSVVQNADFVECALYSVYSSNPSAHAVQFPPSLFPRPLTPHSSKPAVEQILTVNNTIYIPISPPSTVQDFLLLNSSVLTHYAPIDSVASYSQQYASGPGYSFAPLRQDSSKWTYLDVSHVTNATPQSSLLESSYQLALTGLDTHDSPIELDVLGKVNSYRELVLTKGLSIYANITVPPLGSDCTMTQKHRALLLGVAPSVSMASARLLRTGANGEVSTDVISTLLRSLPLRSGSTQCASIVIPRVHRKYPNLEVENLALQMSEQYGKLLPSHSVSLQMSTAYPISQVAVVVPLYSSFGQLRAVSSTFFKNTSSIPFDASLPFAIKAQSPLNALLLSIEQTVKDSGLVHVEIHFGVSSSDPAFDSNFISEATALVASTQPPVTVHVHVLHGFYAHYVSVYNQLAFLAHDASADAVQTLRDDTVLLQKHWLLPSLQFVYNNNNSSYNYSNSFTNTTSYLFPRVVFFSDESASQTVSHIPILFSRTHTQINRGLFHPALVASDVLLFTNTLYRPDVASARRLALRTLTITKNKHNIVERTHTDARVQATLEQHRKYSYLSQYFPHYAKQYFQLHQQWRAIPDARTEFELMQPRHE